MYSVTCGRKFGTKVLHVECDCSRCIQIEDVPDDAVDVLAITRSGKQFREDLDMSDLSMKGPKVWEAQQKCRNKVLKQVQKLRNKVLDIHEESEQKKIQDHMFAQKEENRVRIGKKISDMMSHTTITLDQLLSLVPAFRKEILSQFLGSDDNSEDVHTLVWLSHMM